MGYSVSMPMVVGWGDCDAAGIIFYPRYFEFIENATWNFFESAGLATVDLMEKYGVVGFPTVAVRADFVAPCSYRDRLTIDTEIGRWGRTTLEMNHTIRKGEVELCRGVETRIWATVTREPELKVNPKPFPEELREHFRKLDEAAE